MADLHGLLRRQIKRHLGSDCSPAQVEALLRVVSDTYGEFDSDRATVDRSLDLASQELLERNRRLEDDVGTQRETEHQLKEALSVLKSTVDSTANAILVVDAERRVTLFNEQFREMFNVPQDIKDAHNAPLLLEYLLKQLVDPDQVRARVEQVRDDQGVISYDVIHFTDGRTAEWSSRPQMVDGSPAGQVWTFSDVTERASAALALQRSEEKFSKAFYRSPLAIAITATNDDTFVDVNDAFLQLTGYDRDDVIGKSSQELNLWVRQEDRQTVARLLGELDHAREVQAQFRTRAGRVLEAILTAERLELDGRDCVLSLVQDVTDRIRAENALKASEEQFRSLIENGSDIILVLGTDSMVRYASPSVTRMMGYEVAELQDIDLVSFVHPDDIVETERSFERVIGTNEITCVEIRARHKDGTWRTLEAMSQGVRDADGQWSVIVNCRDITERKRAEETVRYLAYYDALTGLPNRELLRDRLDLAISQARRNTERLAIIYVDLDRFKDVNDSIGHAGGDDLLRSIGDRLSKISRGGDTIARIGGDEFVLLLPQVEGIQEGVNFANRALEKFREPQSIDGHEFHITASIGLSFFPDDGQDSEVLLRNADIAMYRAKDQGRNNLQLYEPSMNASILARLSVERELHQATVNEEFILYYQPVAEIATGRILGAEALIRWQHPVRGLVNPIEFIPIAEDTGLILPIGAWVLRTACAQAAIWERQWPGFRMSVNISARQLLQREFVSIVSDALWNSGLSAGALELEITETVAMANPERTAHILSALQSMGIHSVIDDFGTGYSSLSHLKCLPLFKLKIDRSFVKDLPDDVNDAAIASATIAMAHSLNLIVTAEGVETEAQLDLLSDRGCDEYQGYLLSRPCPADEFTRLLEAHREHPVSTPPPNLMAKRV
ncbi:MAG: EAL domain-containing protein [Dehalococcoidia bacterium]